jgi:hypothetical protein
MKIQPNRPNRRNAKWFRSCEIFFDGSAGQPAAQAVPLIKMSASEETDI